MKDIELVVAIGRNGEIGANNDLIWSFKEDLRHFRKKTIGHACIMGRPTYLGIEKMINKPLPKRQNIVLTRSDWESPHEEVFSANSIESALQLVEEGRNPIIIGGGQIYKQFLPMVKIMHVTHIDLEYEDADTFFEFNPEEFDLIELIFSKEGNPLSYSTYVRK